jgi:cysteine synthase
VDLDSVEYQKNDRGANIRKALLDKIGSPTIPQLFISGTLVGGATEALTANDSGKLQELLIASNVSFNNDKKVVGAEFLPSWVAK